MTSSDARIRHKKAPHDEYVPVPRARPATGRTELTLLCPTCAARVPVAVLSVPEVRRERFRRVATGVAVWVVMWAPAIWGLVTHSVPVALAAVMGVVGLAGFGVAFEVSMTLDDGVRLLERPRRHEVDRPGWDGGDGMEMEAG